MRWLARAVGLHWMIPVAALVGALSCLALGSSIAIPVIDAGSVFGTLPVIALIPLALVTTVGVLLARAAPPESAASSRPHALILGAALVLTAGAYALAHYAGLLIIDQAEDLGAIRNVFAYCALLLIGQATAGFARAPFVPVAYLALSTVFGRINGVIQPWAWPVLPASGTDALLAAAAAVISVAAVAFAASTSTARIYGVGAR